ncbi:hypothetical protein [uncultured Aquimarina sp.]|uniref:hypothetical protein n=1 Tax=uncultured Aquimarina sp. TaxID=575652 RepID=UPI00262551A3|nr:hypothetical protein [uncultured Aquimarina sp.]
MIRSKKTRFRIVSTLILFVFAFLYHLSPYKLEFLGDYDKIWAHRANSIEKLHSALQYFKGVELDLMYNVEGDFLDVNHPPTESIGLRFEDYFDTLDKTEHPLLWLDIKNLNRDTASDILDKLLQVFRKRNYPLQNILIETRYPEVLPLFTKEGFKTSYYLPYDLRKRDEDELRIEILKIEKTLNDQPEIGISTNHKDYHIIKEHFPNRRKYIWILVPFLNIDFFGTKEILKDEKVEVVLINYNLLKGNR